MGLGGHIDQRDRETMVLKKEGIELTHESILAEKNKVLIIFNGDWADEMDVDGFYIVTKERWEYKLKEFKYTKYPHTVSVGTNEEIIYESYEDYISNFTIKEITEEEATTLIKLFGKYGFGKVPFIEGYASEEFYENNKYPRTVDR